MKFNHPDRKTRREEKTRRYNYSVFKKRLKAIKAVEYINKHTSNKTSTDAKKMVSKEQNPKTRFSFEVLPPLKGTGTESLFRTIDTLKEFNPLHINITTHRSEYVYDEQEDGSFTTSFQSQMRDGKACRRGAQKGSTTCPLGAADPLCLRAR